MWHILKRVARMEAMNGQPYAADVQLGRQGRVVIPAELRRSLGFAEGDRLVAREEAGRLVLEKPESIKQRLKARFAKVPRERRLVEELIAERRKEGGRERAE